MLKLKGGVKKDVKLMEDFSLKEVITTEKSREKIIASVFTREMMTVNFDNPRMEYQKNVAKSNVNLNRVKFGQLKLLAVEMEFLNLYWDPKEVPNPVLVYVGAATGEHIATLKKLFPMFEMHLYDGREFDPDTKKTPGIHTYSGALFTDETAKLWRGRRDIYFISDIRSLDYEHFKGSSKEDYIMADKIIDGDMRMQLSWVEIIKPVYSHLKFRVPYYEEWKGTELYPNYPKGILYIQPYAPLVSTECRLVFRSDKVLEFQDWNYRLHEQIMYYHNTITRNKLFINPLTGKDDPIYQDLGFDNNYDDVYFCLVVIDYLKKFGQEPTEKAVMNTIEFIDENIIFGRTRMIDKKTGRKIEEDD